LQDSKVVVVNNTAAATLRQLVIHVFDKVAKEDAIIARGPEHHGNDFAIIFLLYLSILGDANMTVN
jgi:hypothetical protein